MKKFILALATLGLLATLPSCTSKNSQNEDVIAEDSTAEDMAASGGESLDESLDAAQTADTTPSPDANTSVAGTTTDDQLTLDAFGGDANATPTTEPTPDEGMAAQAEPIPPMTTENPSTDIATMEPPTTTTGAEEIAPPVQEMTEQITEKAETDLDQPKPASRSLQKMASAPWKVGSKWVNGIYFARPGDSLDSISQKIYGDDRTRELKKINPTYNNRDVKPGDKVYYASVVRPDDSGQVLTYYEEKNIPAKSYVSKPGDNIRKVSKDLLGYPEAWKEVWAYNSVESKQDIGEGVELRYWEGDSHMGAPILADQVPSTPPQAAVPPPHEDMMAQTPPPPPPASELPPPPDMGGAGQMAGNDLPPPPPPQMEAPPPPPPMEMAPPPPPPMNAGMDKGAPGMEESTSEQDTTLAMGAVAVAVLGAVALIIVRRKRKQREMEQALGETHVG